MKQHIYTHRESLLFIFMRHLSRVLPTLEIAWGYIYSLSLPHCGFDLCYEGETMSYKFHNVLDIISFLI